jgi:hypothetical protein
MTRKLLEESCPNILQPITPDQFMLLSWPNIERWETENLASQYNLYVRAQHTLFWKCIYMCLLHTLPF